MSIKEIRILFTGTPGCGKTTAVHTVGALPFQDINTIEKRTTTIGQDYAELLLADDIVLRCYGTPGQRRFAFIWELLASTADGLIILVDGTRPTPLTDMEIYLENFNKLIVNTAAVICVVKTKDASNAPVLSSYDEHLKQLGHQLPVIFADNRSREDMLNVVDSLLQQLAART